MSKHTVLERPLGQESSTSESIFIREPIPHIPDNVEMRDYQNQAYENWKKNSFRGIFDMATGTGKTYTALAAICRLYKELMAIWQSLLYVLFNTWLNNGVKT